MTKEYMKWRGAVLLRDNYTCSQCGQVGGSLHAHHIKEWAKYPEERYNVENGQTLCKECHCRIGMVNFWNNFGLDIAEISKDAIERLPERNKVVFTKRFGLMGEKKHYYHEIGAYFGVNNSRARQLVWQSCQRLKRLMYA
jgi:hypothetical protein